MISDAAIWRDQWIPWLTHAIGVLVDSPGIWLLSIIGIVILVAISWPEIRNRPTRQTSRPLNSSTSSAAHSSTLRSPSKPESADSDVWAVADEFSLWEAACLWAGTEPVYPPPEGRPRVAFRKLKMAVATRKLGVAAPSIKLVATWSMGHVPTISDIDDNIIVTRSQLLVYAQNIEEQPRFLFK